MNAKFLTTVPMTYRHSQTMKIAARTYTGVNETGLIFRAETPRIQKRLVLLCVFLVCVFLLCALCASVVNLFRITFGF